MKVFLLFGLVAFFVMVNSATEDRCYGQSDCKEGYCCTGGITPYLKGSCRKLGLENERCDSDPPVDGKHFLFCPCAEGLKCFSGGKVIGSRVCVRE